MRRLGLVLSILFAFIVVPARADFPLGSARIESGGAGWLGVNATLAACGTSDCLAVWTRPNGNAGTIVARRTTFGGEPLGDQPFVIREGAIDTLALVSDGAGYVMVLRDRAEGAGGPVSLVRIEADGEIVATPEMIVQPAAAWNRRELTLVASGGLLAGIYDIDDGIHAFVAGPDGRIVQGDRIIVPRVAGMGSFAAVALPGGRIAIHVPVNGVASGATIAARALLDPGFEPVVPQSMSGVGGRSAEWRVVSTGNELLVSWRDSVTFALWAQVISLDGAPLSAPVLLPENVRATTFAAVGDHYLAVRVDFGGFAIAATTISATGEVLETVPLVRESSRAAYGIVVTNRVGALFLWTSRRDPHWPAVLRGDALDAGANRRGGADGAGFPISAAPAVQDWPAAAARDDGQLFAWVETTDVQRLMLARYDRVGRPVDREPLVVREAVIAGPPALASDGRGAIVLWPETVAGGQAMMAAYVEAGATRVRPESIVELERTRYGWLSVPTAVAVGGQYLAAWSDDVQRAIHTVRWSAEGQKLDAAPRALTLPGTANRPNECVGDENPALVSNGDDAYLLFGRVYAAPGPVLASPDIHYLHELHGIRVSADGIAIGEERLLSLPLVAGQDALLAAGVADGDGVVASWFQYAGWGEPPYVGTRRIDGAGTMSAAEERMQAVKVAPRLVRAGGGGSALLAFGTTLADVDRAGSLRNERQTAWPVEAALADGARVIVVQRRIVDGIGRLFVVPLSPARVRAVPR